MQNFRYSVSVSFDHHLKNRVDFAARTAGISRSQFIERALRQFLDQTESQEPRHVLQEASN